MPLENHEPRESLPENVIDQRRAIASMIEELEAVAWYNERAAVSQDQELRDVLEHNRNEEIEHASMLAEWLRRNFPEFDENFRTYLFTDKPLLEVEEESEEGEEGQDEDVSVKNQPSPSQSLSIGSLRKGR